MIDIEDIKGTVFDVISYSRCNGNILTDGECIALHQWARLGIKISNVLLRQKFMAIDVKYCYINKSVDIIFATRDEICTNDRPI